MLPQHRKALMFCQVFAVAALIFFLLLVTGSYSHSLAAQKFATMPITHILLVSFNPTAPRATVEAICNRIIAFKTECLDAQGKPYVLATKGGINNNPEGSNKNMTHGFIIEFKNEADRQYFLDVDQAHKDFVEHIDPNNNDFLTLDFTDGIC